MRALYAAASGMAAQQNRLDNVANNLANVSTTGFKKSRQAFQDLYYQELTTGGAGKSAAPVQLGSGVRTAAISRDLTQGSITQTGNPLDVAISGDGFLSLEAEDGQIFYTRDGSLRTNAEGTLVTASGVPLAGGITVPSDVDKVEIAEDGTISGRFAGQDTFTTLGQLEVVSFGNPAGLEAVGGNLYRQSAQSGDPQTVDTTQATVVQGYLEGSNVDVAQELVEMILAQRSFELNSKAVQAADDTLQIAVNLKR